MKITDFINQLNTVMQVEGNIHIVPFCVTFQTEEMTAIFDSISQLPTFGSPKSPMTENEVDTIVTSVFNELNDQVHELVSDSLLQQSADKESK